MDFDLSAVEITRFVNSVFYVIVFYIHSDKIVWPLHELVRELVVEIFSELHKKYFVNRGFMVSTVNDEFSKQFVETHPEIEWVHTYSRYAETDIQVAQINVAIFGNSFPVLV